MRAVRSTFPNVRSGLPLGMLSIIAGFFAKLSRSFGANVSLRKKKPITCIPASTIDVAQNTHRHVVLSEIKPPAVRRQPCG